MTYSLDNIDRRILYELDKNCRISDNKLAKIVKRSRETVRNRINKLVKYNIIQGFITSINPSKVGYLFFKLYFQLANKPQERKRFFRYFKNLPGIYWFGSNDGIWDFHGTLYAKTLEDFNIIKNNLNTEFKDLILNRQFGVLLSVKQFSKRYLLPKIIERAQPTLYAGELQQNKLDDIDIRILNVLSNNACIPLVNLAQEIKSTVSIVRTRMKRMEEKGLIMQYRIAIDHSKLGLEYFKAFIYFENLTHETEMKLLEYAHNHKEIVLLIRQLSAWDIELEIMAENYESFNRIMDDIRLEFSNVIRNYEFVLMREDVWYFGEKKVFSDAI